METDIIDEIERHLSSYRCTDASFSLNIMEESKEEHKTPGFNKSWCKLGLQEKLNRLMRYLSVIQSKITLETRQVEDIRKFFYDNVNTTLASDDYVNYDPVEGEIVTILGLKYDDSVYIQPPSAKPEGLRVKQRVFASIQQIQEGRATCPPPPAAVAPPVAASPVAAPTATPVKKVVIVKKKIESV